MDNAGEFTSKSFDAYYASLGIEVDHPVPYVHTQNGLAEFMIKHVQIIARTLLLRTKLGSSAWGHVVCFMNQTFHICALLIALCRCRLYPYKGLRWVLNAV